MRWRGTLGVEGEWSADHRLVRPGATTWPRLPLDVHSLEGERVGCIDRIERRGNRIHSEGSLTDAGAEDVRSGRCTAIAIDGAHCEFDPATSPGAAVFSRLEVGAGILVDRNAWPDATIELVEAP